MATAFDVVARDERVDIRDLASIVETANVAEEAQRLSGAEAAVVRNTQDEARHLLAQLGYAYPSNWPDPWQVWVVDTLREWVDRNGPTMVAEDYWSEYVKDYADDMAPEPGGVLGMVREEYRDAWPYRFVTIDWEAAGNALRSDYSEVEFCGRSWLVGTIEG